MKGNVNGRESLNIYVMEQSLMKVLFPLNFVTWSKILDHTLLIHILVDLVIYII